MVKSESIGKLAEALAKAQGAIEGAKKETNNVFFKSKYADLSSVWEACRKPLADNGLAIIQATCGTDPETVTVETILTHSSGEWISSRLTMKPVKADPQGIGSCLTYARRYSLAAMVGVAPEDDDGNAASQPTQSAKQFIPPRAPQAEDPRETKKYDLHPEFEKDVPSLLGDEKPDEAKIIAGLKERINGLMLGFKAPQKKEFFEFVVKDNPITVDLLQDFVDRYLEKRRDYMEYKNKEKVA